MSAESVLAAVVDLLERCGWVAAIGRAGEGSDLIGAFEQVSGLALRGVPVAAAGARTLTTHPDCDQALRWLAQVIVDDPAHETPDGVTDDALAVISSFNDRPGQTWAVVRRTLHEARELSRVER